MRFFYVYVLESEEKDWIYVGFTKDLRMRVEEHDKGKVKSTRHYLPLKLIFCEAYLSQSDAKRREQYLKTTKGKQTLRSMLKDYFHPTKT